MFVNTAMCCVFRGVIQAAVMLSIKQVRPLLTTVTKFSGKCIDTDIPALHPPALVITDVRHIIQVTSDVAIRMVTVPARCPRWDKMEENEKQGHDTQARETNHNQLYLF